MVPTAMVGAIGAHGDVFGRAPFGRVAMRRAPLAPVTPAHAHACGGVLSRPGPAHPSAWSAPTCAVPIRGHQVTPCAATSVSGHLVRSDGTCRSSHPGRRRQIDPYVARCRPAGDQVDQVTRWSPAHAHTPVQGADAYRPDAGPLTRPAGRGWLARTRTPGQAGRGRPAALELDQISSYKSPYNLKGE